MEQGKEMCLSTLDSINRNENGDYYFIFKIPCSYGSINRKGKKPENEILIWGVPQARLIEAIKAIKDDL